MECIQDEDKELTILKITIIAKSVGYDDTDEGSNIRQESSSDSDFPNQPSTSQKLTKINVFIMLIALIKQVIFMNNWFG